jgi:hypothetical protein
MAHRDGVYPSFLRPTKEGSNDGKKYSLKPLSEDPLLAYPHSSTDPSVATGCSITGGTFYDPTTPTTSFAPYQGKYFYTDYCSGWIRSFDPVAKTSAAFASGIVKPVDLEVGDNGSLYYLYRGSSSVPAAVHEIR